MTTLKCRECGEEYEAGQQFACDQCFGPLEVIYDVNSITLNRNQIKRRTNSIWRYHELLPIKDKTKIVDLGVGFTTLHDCKRLAKQFKLKKVFVKDDTLNPTGSFKDRPAAVAVTKAIELGFNTVGCASTGNLAAATAAHAAKAGIPCYVFIPSNTEPSKVLQASTYGAKIISVKGTYDETNRIASQATDEYNLGSVNINIRPYYVEGSKTLAFEICEQLGWRSPDNIIIPMGSGALLCAVWRALNQLKELGLTKEVNTKIIGVQPIGCSPIVEAFKSKSDDIFPIENPKTIAKSLAIGDPSDGIYALRVIRDSGGIAEYATDDEIIKAIHLVAKTEGIFSEPAGGVTIAVLKKLTESGEISSDEDVVCCVTASGFKSQESIMGSFKKPVEIAPSIEELSRIIKIGKENGKS